MVLITKTSDQTRQREHTLSTCTVHTYALGALCPPSASLRFSRLSEFAATESTLSCLRFPRCVCIYYNSCAFSCNSSPLFHPSQSRPRSRSRSRSHSHLRSRFHVRYSSRFRPRSRPRSHPVFVHGSPSPSLFPFPSRPRFRPRSHLILRRSPPPPFPFPPPTPFTSPFPPPTPIPHPPPTPSLLPVPRTLLPPRYDARVQAPGLANEVFGCPQVLPSVCRDGNACEIKVSDRFS